MLRSSQPDDSKRSLGHHPIANTVAHSHTKLLATARNRCHPGARALPPSGCSFGSVLTDPCSSFGVFHTAPQDDHGMLLPFYYVLRENGTLYGTTTVSSRKQGHHRGARCACTFLVPVPNRRNRTGVRKLPQCHPVFFFVPLSI
jgi:hypothetical protein